MDRSAIFEEIREVLEGNGTIPQVRRERLMLTMIAEIYRTVEGDGGLNKRLKAVEEFIPMMNILKWVSVVLGASIIALIWALITGQAEIAFH